jgi:hypothetical protein
MQAVTARRRIFSPKKSTVLGRVLVSVRHPHVRPSAPTTTCARPMYAVKQPTNASAHTSPTVAVLLGGLLQVALTPILAPKMVVVLQQPDNAILLISSVGAAVLVHRVLPITTFAPPTHALITRVLTLLSTIAVPLPASVETPTAVRLTRAVLGIGASMLSRALVVTPFMHAATEMYAQLTHVPHRLRLLVHALLQQ